MKPNSVPIWTWGDMHKVYASWLLASLTAFERAIGSIQLEEMVGDATGNTGIGELLTKQIREAAGHFQWLAFDLKHSDFKTRRIMPVE